MSVKSVSNFGIGGPAMVAFWRRLLFHYEIYRRYPLPPISALKNAWRMARAR